MFNRRSNLFSKNDWRAALADEVEPDGSEVPFVMDSFLFPGDGERLTGAAPRPDGALFGPVGEEQRTTPPSDSGEEMALRKVGEVLGVNVYNTPVVYYTVGD